MILQHLTFLEEALSATSILKAKEPYELVIYKRFCLFLVRSYVLCLLAIFFLHLIVHRLYIEVGIKVRAKKKNNWIRHKKGSLSRV